MSSEYFCVLYIFFLFMYFHYYYYFDWNFTPFHPISTATVFLFILFSTEPVSDTKITVETVNKLLHATAPALESNVREKGIVGHSPRYSRIKNLFGVEVENLKVLKLVLLLLWTQSNSMISPLFLSLFYCDSSTSLRFSQHQYSSLTLSVQH